MMKPTSNTVDKLKAGNGRAKECSSGGGGERTRVRLLLIVLSVCAL